MSAITPNPLASKQNPAVPGPPPGDIIDPNAPQDTTPAENKKPFRPLRVLLYAAIIFGAAVSLFPFYWMFVLATNKSSTIYEFPPKVLPGPELKTNLSHVFENIDFLGSLGNTVIVACSVTFLVLFFDSLAAFCFSKFEFPGKKFFFGLMMLTFLLPAQLATIPQFLVMVKLGWVSSLKALIIPSAANAFGIFWLKQYMETSVPPSLLEAARLDGCGFFRQYLHVAIPTSRPALAFLGIFTFIGAWNDFMWPLIVLNDPNKLTLQVAMSQLNVAHGQDYGMLMAGALIAVVPLIAVFILGARHFINNLTAGAVKQ